MSVLRHFPALVHKLSPCPLINSSRRRPAPVLAAAEGQVQAGVCGAGGAVPGPAPGVPVQGHQPGGHGLRLRHRGLAGQGEVIEGTTTYVCLNN